MTPSVTRQSMPHRPLLLSRVAVFTLGVLAMLSASIGDIAAAPVSPARPAPALSKSVSNEAMHSLDLGSRWLIAQQTADGSWAHGYPAITGLAATALLRDPAGDPASKAAGRRALAYLAKQVKPDGGIYPEKAPQMQSYNTSICLMAFLAADDRSYDELIRGARAFLLSQQADESKGYGPDSIFYGGIGYGDDGTPDLSNLQWALEALKATQDYAPRDEASASPVDVPHSSTGGSGVSGQGVFWDKAIAFLERCQNLHTAHGSDPDSGHGGFIYDPEESKAGGRTSYGSMSYAGMKSFIHAGVSRDDPRVQAAYQWCSRNYTIDRNPEMGQQGYFYYLHTMAKALEAYGQETIPDSLGRPRRWREDITVKLASLQDPQGFWKNPVGRWWENDPELVTSYSLLTLEEALGKGLLRAYPKGKPR